MPVDYCFVDFEAVESAGSMRASAARHCGLFLPGDRLASRLYWVWLMKRLDLSQLLYYLSIDRCNGTSRGTYVSVVFSDSSLLRFSDFLDGIFESWVVFCSEGRTALNSAGGFCCILATMVCATPPLRVRV